MAVGGVAVRVTAEGLCSGSVRLRHSTAVQFLGPIVLPDPRVGGGDEPKAFSLHPCPGESGSTPLHAQLRIVTTAARQTHSLGASPPPPPPLHCEMCGLGAWLRGQGAVPGVHWVQLWRGAGGALRLRLCAGKPTALPGEEAEAAAEQQVVAAATQCTVTAFGAGASDSAAEAAAADAAAQLVGAAAQAVADAAAPWQHLAPTCTAPCLPARAAWQGCLLGATGAGADGMGPAARCSPGGDLGGPLPTTQGSGSGGGSGPVTSGSAGRDAVVGASCHGLLDAAPPHPHRAGDMGSAGPSLSLSPLPIPPPALLPAVPMPQLPSPVLSPPPPPPELPAQQAPHPAAQAGAPADIGKSQVQSAAGFGSAGATAAIAAAAATIRIMKTVTTVRTIAVGGRHVGWLNNDALALWPDACQLQFGQAAAVTLHLVKDQLTTPTRHTAVKSGVSAVLARYNATWFALVGLGQAGDVFSLWRDHAGVVWASHQHSGTGQGLQQLGQGQGQQGQGQGQQGQGQGQGQDGGGDAAARRPCSTGILTGRVSQSTISLRAEEVQGLLAPSLPQGHSQCPHSVPEWITVHVEVVDGSHIVHQGAQQPQQQGSEFAVRLVCIHEPGRKSAWHLSSAGALLNALGAVEGDAIQLHYVSAGRLTVRRAAGQQLHHQQRQRAAGAAPLAVCPTDSILLGCKFGSRVDPRVGSVNTLWPEVASQLACGESTEVEVHTAAKGAGGEAVGRFRLTLARYSWPTRPVAWRLSGCGPLFRALGAQDGDAIYMCRSPGDGRLVVGVQPRDGVHTGTGVKQQGQEVPPRQQEHVQQGAVQQGAMPQGVVQQEHEQQGHVRCRHLEWEAPQEHLLQVYSERVASGASGGEDGQGEGLDDDKAGGEEWKGGERGQRGQDEVSPAPPGDGLSRPSKRARAAEGAAQHHGGLSAPQQQQQQQPAACPAGSVLVGFKHRTQLDARLGAVRALWPEIACQLACGQSTEVEVHAAGSDAGREVLGPFHVKLKLYSWSTRPVAWRIHCCGPLFRALGARDGDAIHMWRLPADRRLMAEAQPRGGVDRDQEGQQQRQQAKKTACTAGSIFIGRKHYSKFVFSATAARALWPGLPGQLACGESAEVEVHPAIEGAGGEAAGPFLVMLKMQTWKGKSHTWRLTGCGPLFQALGAQNRDAIHMWRSPKDGRLMAGVQPRGGVFGKVNDVQLVQRVAGPRRGAREVRQVYDEYDVHETSEEGQAALEEGEDDEEEEDDADGGFTEEEGAPEGQEEREEAGHEAVGYGGDAHAGAGLGREVRAGRGRVIPGGGGMWGEAGEEEVLEEEEEEEEEPGVNWWAREVGGEFGFREEGGVGEQVGEQI